MTWADSIRAAFKEGIWDLDEVHALVTAGERQLEHAHNTIECLVEANAALREQLCEMKHSRRSGDKPIHIGGDDVPRP